MENELEMRFDPKTIEHLGVKMYSTLPPALSELISNSYDADASVVNLKFHENAGKPVSISVVDDGEGMSWNDIQNKFLIIGRNRRKDSATLDIPSQRFKRKATGKKGLGKLALFGLAELITVRTIKDKKLTTFTLSWSDLLNTEQGSYKPIIEHNEKSTSKPNGTTIKLSKLKRKSKFDLDSLANSISKIFNIDSDFSISLINDNDKKITIDNTRRYNSIDKEFSWDIAKISNELDNKINIIGEIFTSSRPIPPSSELRGITIYSRGKLVNLPEYFSDSSSSHFYQYVTGWIQADFIDDLPEDVISTNRQSLNWSQDDMNIFREHLRKIVAKIGNEWRNKRKLRKEKEINEKIGIDTETWYSTLPVEMVKSTKNIVERITENEAIDNPQPIIEALHSLIPEYPLLHWRHLPEELKDRVESFYKNGQYGIAAEQATKIYCEILREKSGLKVDGTDLMGKVFSFSRDGTPPKIAISDLETDSGRNMQLGQHSMSRGLIEGFRNPTAHTAIDKLVPSQFSEIDCLNVLSLTSYLLTRVNNTKENQE